MIYDCTLLLESGVFRSFETLRTLWGLVEVKRRMAAMSRISVRSQPSRGLQVSAALATRGKAMRVLVTAVGVDRVRCDGELENAPSRRPGL